MPIDDAIDTVVMAGEDVLRLQAARTCQSEISRVLRRETDAT
jgi:hypothetical protein